MFWEDLSEGRVDLDVFDDVVDPVFVLLFPVWTPWSFKQSLGMNGESV